MGGALTAAIFGGTNLFATHPVFAAPSDAAIPIWRYMDLPKFVSILSKGALYFPVG